MTGKCLRLPPSPPARRPAPRPSVGAFSSTAGPRWGAVPAPPARGSLEAAGLEWRVRPAPRDNCGSGAVGARLLTTPLSLDHRAREILHRHVTRRRHPLCPAGGSVAALSARIQREWSLPGPGKCGGAQVPTAKGPCVCFSHPLHHHSATLPSTLSNRLPIEVGGNEGGVLENVTEFKHESSPPKVPGPQRIWL